ncbi:MAG TPA: DUF4190 domain-containing protein [Gemmataceae bacterium]|jgi:hypothetical protein|nr:DUF4190 domain-containing protein [Gemmataceae bacterium]
MPRRERDDDDDFDRDDRRPARRRDDDIDDYDDIPAGRRRPPRKSGDGMAHLIPFRNGWALAAYYCGIFGLIPIVGFLLGIVAFILGIIGFVRARKNPNAHGTGHAIAGIILGPIDIVIWPILWIYVFDNLTKG